MTTRIRSRNKTIGGAGLAEPLTAGLSPQYWGADSMYEWMSDVVGNPHSPNPLYLWQRRNYGYATGGDIPGYWRCRNVPKNNGMTKSHFDSRPASKSIPSDNHLLLQGKAQTNPNRPDVSLPVFLFELRDIPRMIKGWADSIMKKSTYAGAKDLKSLPRQTAAAYVEYQFGIAPVIQDVQKMLMFTKNVERKLNMIQRLGNPGGASNAGTVFEDEYHDSDWSEYVSSLYMEFRRIEASTIINRKYWVSTRWEPTAPLPQTSSGQLDLAWRLSMDLNISYATLWQAMPWSWLIGWFTELDSAMQNTRNTVPVRAVDLCLMKKTWATVKVNRVLTQGVPMDVRAFPDHAVSKERIVGGPVVPIDYTLPLLTGSQTAILGSLAVLKLGR